MKLWVKFILFSTFIAIAFNACKQESSAEANKNRITEFNYIDIAAESVKFADVPATINTLNTALVFSAYTLHTAQGLEKKKKSINDAGKMKLFLQDIQMGLPGEFSFKPGPINCPEGGERDNQIVSLVPNEVNMTVSLAQCQFNGKVANGFIQIKKLNIQGVPLANAAWTVAVDLNFDLTLRDAKNIIAPVGLNGDAQFTMTAASQLYSMSISGKNLRLGVADRQQTLKDYNLITANDSANGFYSITIDANYHSERFGDFYIKTNPNLVVNSGGGSERCRGVMTVSQIQQDDVDPTHLRIMANDSRPMPMLLPVSNAIRPVLPSIKV